MYLAGVVDERMIDKFKREAISKGRDSWFLAYIMDENDEEKEKGKTVEVGRAAFQTEKKRYTLLDAPGHQAYVPNMIIAAAQADAGILVISARQQEFERGFDRAGQTREHVLIAKTLNVGRLLVVVNKMDEPTVQWSEDRYKEIVGTLNPFLKKTGFKGGKNFFLCTLIIFTVYFLTKRCSVHSYQRTWRRQYFQGSYKRESLLVQRANFCAGFGRGGSSGEGRLRACENSCDRQVQRTGKIRCDGKDRKRSGA